MTGEAFVFNSLPQTLQQISSDQPVIIEWQVHLILVYLIMFLIILPFMTVFLMTGLLMVVFHMIKKIHERSQKIHIQCSDTRTLLALQEGINLKFMVKHHKYSENITIFHDQCVTVDSAFGTYINQIIRVMYLDQTLRYFASIVLCKTDTFLHPPVCASAIL